MEDRSIIQLYWQRDETAIQETNTKYGAYCFQIAHNILANDEDAQECVNDTYWHAWNAMPPQQPSRLRLFLAKITRNLSFDYYKAQHTQKRGNGQLSAVLEELQDCLAASDTVDHAVLAAELANSINQFLRRLPERECHIFLRRYFYVEPIPTIAQRYRLKESNVLMILSRTRKKLRIYLEQEGYTP